MANKKIFSFYEILAAIAVILFLTLILYPKFIDIIRKSHEATTRSNLTALRSAIAIYYGDNEGRFPAGNLAEVLTAENGRYIKYIPEVYCPPYHNITNEITYEPTGDSGKWAYQTSDGQDRQWGEIWIDCNHKDTKGVVWNTY